jgi:hypothetical protein
MLTIKRNKDRTITITFRLFRWRWAVHIRDVEFWTVSKCQTNVS